MDFYDGQERFPRHEGHEGGISDADLGRLPLLRGGVGVDDDRSDVERFSDAFHGFMQGVASRMPGSWLSHLHDRFFRALRAELLADPDLRSHARGVILDPKFPRSELELPHTMPPANGPKYPPNEPASKRV